MTTQTLLKTVPAIGVLTAMLLAPAAQAGPYDEPAYLDELTVCATALRKELEDADTMRIEHRLIRVEPRGAGYAFRIETRLYTDSDPAAVPVSTTRADCRAQGSERLIDLSIQRPAL